MKTSLVSCLSPIVRAEVLGGQLASAKAAMIEAIKPRFLRDYERNSTHAIEAVRIAVLNHYTENKVLDRDGNRIVAKLRSNGSGPRTLAPTPEEKASKSRSNAPAVAASRIEAALLRSDKKPTPRQKRNAGIERAVAALGRLDYDTLVEVQRQLPAIIKAKRAK